MRSLFGVGAVEVVLYFHEFVAEVVVVEVGGAVGGGVEEVEVQEDAEDVVGGQTEEEEEIAGGACEGREETEDDPVGQPLLSAAALPAVQRLPQPTATLKVMYDG